MRIGVRLSAFDFPPFTTSQQGAGRPVPTRVPYHSAFGLDPESPLHIDLEEPMRFVALLSEIGVELVNVTGGSPYYNPHIQRPALFPPSDGYQPPEDPLVGVARQIGVCAELKSHFPNIAFVGSAYSYLQEWIPHVAQRVVREGKAEFVGLGRSMLPYPDLPADVLAGRPLDRRRICRTLSDCTTAPRHGLVSGCYPLDEGYRALDDYAKLQQAKKELGEAV
jgi:2,4-dienoyl-CoA reductase-like NADH-dependent reductase (Old Yellow Enzyme family)